MKNKSNKLIMVMVMLIVIVLSSCSSSQYCVGTGEKMRKGCGGTWVK